jgi:hypothetical protein
MYSVSDEITPWTLFFLHWGVGDCVLDVVGGVASAMEDDYVLDVVRPCQPEIG